MSYITGSQAPTIRGASTTSQFHSDTSFNHHNRKTGIHDVPSLTMQHHKRIVHTSILFNAKNKKYEHDLSLEIDLKSGAIVKVYKREEDDEINKCDIDLRDKFVMPGLVDSHTHIFLHAYKYVLQSLISPIHTPLTLLQVNAHPPSRCGMSRL